MVSWMPLIGEGEGLGWGEGVALALGAGVMWTLGLLWVAAARVAW
jgi:hypothetical protein